MHLIKFENLKDNLSNEMSRICDFIDIKFHKSLLSCSFGGYKYWGNTVTVAADKFDENNLLTRGQTVQNVSFQDTVANKLSAGQLSLHHPMIVHGSGPNKSNHRRIGFVIQSYIGTNVRQTLGKNGVQIARGVDNYHYHDHSY